MEAGISHSANAVFAAGCNSKIRTGRKTYDQPFHFNSNNVSLLTARSSAKVQAAHGLRPAGVVRPKTLAALGI
jgi:hypothetical protein